LIGEHIQTHNTIAETHIHIHQGELLKTYGDGMMACFEQPVQAPQFNPKEVERFLRIVEERKHKKR